MNVKRKDLIRQLCDDYNYTQESASRIIDDFTDLILTNMKEGNTVSVYGFGVFDMVERSARRSPNPQTGEMIDIPAHWVPKFYPGNRMKTCVKIWEDNLERSRR